MAGADISVSFAKEIAINHHPDRVSSALEELRRQLSRGVGIRRGGALASVILALVLDVWLLGIAAT